MDIYNENLTHLRERMGVTPDDGLMASLYAQLIVTILT